MTCAALTCGLLATSAVLAAGPLAQWNSLAVGSLVDTDNSGEVVNIVPAAGWGIAAGCVYTDLYVMRDPAVIHSALALLTTAMVMGWQVEVLTSGTCDLSGRPLVVGVQLLGTSATQ